MLLIWERYRLLHLFRKNRSYLGKKSENDKTDQLILVPFIFKQKFSYIQVLNSVPTYTYLYLSRLIKLHTSDNSHACLYSHQIEYSTLVRIVYLRSLRLKSLSFSIRCPQLLPFRHSSAVPDKQYYPALNLYHSCLDSRLHLASRNPLCKS